jgi:uncharacterized protein (DUF2062 family)
MGAQIILAGVAAYFLKVNIPLALAGSLITNPFTAAIIYPLEYQFGVWLVGVPAPSDLEGYTGMMRSFARYAKPLWTGSLVAGGVAAAVAYGLVTLLWKEAVHLRAIRKHGPETLPVPAASGAGPVAPAPPDSVADTSTKTNGTRAVETNDG